MKVIMIKKYSKYNVDEIIEVSDGFGKNFLINNGYALPINEATSKNLEKRKEIKKEQFEQERQKAILLKEQIEALELIFYLKVTNDVVHGSISTKKVSQELKQKNIKLDKHVLPHISIVSLGITNIKFKIFDDIEAILKINVKGEYGKQ